MEVLVTIKQPETHTSVSILKELEEKKKKECNAIMRPITQMLFSPLDGKGHMCNKRFVNTL